MKKFNDNKSELMRPASVSVSESVNGDTPKITGMMIVNPERKRSSSNASSKRKSPTPQKSFRGITVTEPSTRKNEQSNIVFHDEAY